MGEEEEKKKDEKNTRYPTPEKKKNACMEGGGTQIAPAQPFFVGPTRPSPKNVRHINRTSKEFHLSSIETDHTCPCYSCPCSSRRGRA